MVILVDRQSGNLMQSVSRRMQPTLGLVMLEKLYRGCSAPDLPIIRALPHDLHAKGTARTAATNKQTLVKKQMNPGRQEHNIEKTWKPQSATEKQADQL